MIPTLRSPANPPGVYCAELGGSRGCGGDLWEDHRGGARTRPRQLGGWEGRDGFAHALEAVAAGPLPPPSEGAAAPCSWSSSCQGPLPPASVFVWPPLSVSVLLLEGHWSPDLGSHQIQCEHLWGSLTIKTLFSKQGHFLRFEEDVGGGDRVQWEHGESKKASWRKQLLHKPRRSRVSTGRSVSRAVQVQVADLSSS